MSEGQLIRNRRESAVPKVKPGRPGAHAIDLATRRIMGVTFRNDSRRMMIPGAEGEKIFRPGRGLKTAAAGDAVDGDHGVGRLQKLPRRVSVALDRAPFPRGLRRERARPCRKRARSAPISGRRAPLGCRTGECHSPQVALDQPVIAALNGTCRVDRLAPALACDPILAADTATFALPEVHSVAMADVAGIGLPGRIPCHVAMDLLLIRRWFDVEEALRRGLFREATAPEALRSEACELGRPLQCGPLPLLARFKEIVGEAGDMQLRDALSRVTGRQYASVDRHRTSADRTAGERQCGRDARR
jgi:crotonobetainyl-CoA hydratase